MTFRRSPVLLLAPLLLGAIVALPACRTKTPPAPPTPVAQDPLTDAAAIASNNRGVALMGQYEYAEAAELFGSLVEQYPDWIDVKVNWAIATLNRQQPGANDDERALEILEEVLAVEPDHLRARYTSGFLLRYLGQVDEAAAQFRFVAEQDPNDPYAAYFVALDHFSRGEFEAALALYERAIELDPYFQSAYNGRGQTLMRLGRADEGRAALEMFQRLGQNPRAHLVQTVYTQMGIKAETIALGRPAADPTRPAGPIFDDPRPLAPLPDGAAWRAEGTPTFVDINGDGRTDVFIAGGLTLDGATANAVVLAADDLTFAVDLAHPLTRVEAVNTALWGDVDNDGATDVYLLRNGPNQLWMAGSDGWTDATADADVADGEYRSVDGAAIDADHDGDLDLFVVNADGPNELFSNNLDGTFRRLAADQGLAGAGEGRAIVTGDLDGDRDVDLIVLNAAPPHEVYLNDRAWSYRTDPRFAAIERTPVTAALIADLDADGWTELHTAGPDGVRRWSPGSDGAWVASAAGPPTGMLAAADLDGDGVTDLLATAEGLRHADGSASFIDGDAPVRLAPLDERGPSAVALADDGPLLHPPGPGRFDFVTLRLTGMIDPAKSMRSNASGIGAEVAARVGTRWTITSTFRPDSGPGQSLVPIAIGLGGAPELDFIALDWSDGLFQTELALAPEEMHVIEETQRQVSSCPVVFAWNGEEYGYVSDVLGVGGIGFMLAPGEYVTPRPWERFLMPDGSLAPTDDDEYVIKIGEPMEEACYLDHVGLVAYDLPPGWRMTLDERMGTGDPAPTGETRFYRTTIRPALATNDRGEDVTASLRRTDDVAAPIEAILDRRFLGRTATPHVLTLTFDTPLDTLGDDLMLIANGWVEYPYSQTMFAAWQANAPYLPPTIEARGADGVWQTILPTVGYPAGMPREMSVPLPDLPAGTDALRISTTLEIYWDGIEIAAVALPDVEISPRRLDLVGGTCARVGFPERIDGPQKRPNYDYDRRVPLWDTRHLPGAYTAFGEVTSLIAATDDALAIFGPGEEVEARFDAAGLPVLPDGWTRRFVLETTGWCKDMDLYTRTGESLAPIPAHADPTDRPEPHDDLNRRYRAR